ncbi:hypothetical protein GCM10027570_14870 [Streptomonospora sediminis]
MSATEVRQDVGGRLIGGGRAAQGLAADGWNGADLMAHSAFVARIVHGGEPVGEIADGGAWQTDVAATEFPWSRRAMSPRFYRSSVVVFRPIAAIAMMP